MKNVTLIWSQGHKIKTNMDDSDANQLVKDFSDATKDVLTVSLDSGDVTIKKFALVSIQLTEDNGLGYLNLQGFDPLQNGKWVRDRNSRDRVKWIPANE